jgi:hypothetical protein
MNAWIKWIGVGALALFASTVNAQEPRDVAAPAPAVSQQDGAKLVETLSALVKERLTNALPPQLVIEKDNNWGHQAQIQSLQGLTPIHVMRNHGNWEKSRVIARDVPHRLRVNIGRLYSTAENRVSFVVHVALPADLDLRQQTWQNGVQVFTSHLRSRFQLSAHLDMETDMQPAGAGATSPGNVVRLRLVRGTYSCDHFVAENVNGLGGDVARWLDSGAGRSFKPWQPAILNDFQNTVANVVGSAGEASEVRTCLSKLLLHSNSVRSTYAPPPSTTLDAANVPTVPRSVPLCLSASFEFEISDLGRMSVPHVKHLPHPALTDFAVHVAHAALVAAASHIHDESEHTIHIHHEPEHKR